MRLTFDKPGFLESVARLDNWKCFEDFVEHHNHDMLLNLSPCKDIKEAMCSIYCYCCSGSDNNNISE